MIKLIIFIFVLVVSNTRINGEIVQEPIATFDVKVTSVTTSKVNLQFNYTGLIYETTVFTVNINNEDYALCTAITAFSCLVTGLNADTEYQFKVTAVNNGTTLYSSFNVKTYTIISTPSIEVFQSQHEGSYGLLIYLSDIGGVPYEFVYNYSINGNSTCKTLYHDGVCYFSVGTDSPGKIYNIHVQVVNDGHTVNANFSYVLVPFLSDFTVNVSQITSDGFTVEWTECTGGKDGATTYDIYILLSNNWFSNKILACTGIVSPRTCKVSNLLEDTTYYIKVRASNPANKFPLSSDKQTKTLKSDSVSIEVPIVNSASTLKLPLFIITLYSILMTLISI
ncbi:hypothetical protein DLAC_10359 [Tieghemostelium lacteum]|uniref:Fibronectin type-III domain-containing protein n=1 Tax=Tieghemostelium lacteum TaxID=361077 RepID=A0A151Z580_TIELA|nr:hypothetical protein DLAC_10359 [Tieghemostelium lacteum]|eukprot:KYQ89120.1 hypothetical protein DLAC_10359 [Tieghemostelium lacteum]